MSSYYRNNNSSSSAGKYCKVCADAKRPESEYRSHNVRENGVTTCPTLLSQSCKYCHAPGHTVKFCPELEQKNKGISAATVAPQLPVHVPAPIPAPVPVPAPVVRSNPVSASKYCKVCADAKRPESEYRSHNVRENDVTTCPTLLSQSCKYCHAPGHTVKFCPELEKKNQNQTQTPLPQRAPAPIRTVAPALQASTVAAPLSIPTNDRWGKVASLTPVVRVAPVIVPKKVEVVVAPPKPTVPVVTVVFKSYKLNCSWQDAESSDEEDSDDEVEETVEAKVEETVEAKVEETVEAKVEAKVEETVEAKVEVKVEVNVSNVSNVSNVLKVKVEDESDEAPVNTLDNRLVSWEDEDVNVHIQVAKPKAEDLIAWDDEEQYEKIIADRKARAERLAEEKERQKRIDEENAAYDAWPRCYCMSIGDGYEVRYLSDEEDETLPKPKVYKKGQYKKRY